MQEPLKVFIGYDSKEPIAYHVLSHSIMRRASRPVSITPLALDNLQGIYTRQRGPTESTEFSLTRFLVPYLSGYQGHSVFMDCDMLCLTDMNELWGLILAEFQSEYECDRYSPSHSVLCCQHDYTPKSGVKFLNQVQTAYPRKNWSSFMVFNNDRCKSLTPEYVNSATGLELHRFLWTDDKLIKPLPLEWNWLIGEYQDNSEAKILHYTLGGPWFPDFSACDRSTDWLQEYSELALHSKAIPATAGG
jgi:lipopolysaccharide biosynthesis glycosyltransferase